MKISERTKERINRRVDIRELLEPSPKAGKGFYCCPFCGSGHGPHGTGALKVDTEKNRWECYSCGKHGDVLDFIQEKDGVGFADAVRIGAEMAGINVELDNGETVEIDHTGHLIALVKTKRSEENLTAYFQLCAARAGQTDYLQQRGISAETAEKYMIGFDPDYRRGTGGRSWKAVIIPTGPDSFVARNTESTGKGDRYRKTGTANIFGWTAARKSEKPIFVVEGELDALAVVEAGGAAVGLGSTGNVGKLLELIKEDRPEQPLILCLDRDESGQAAESDLAAELKRLQVSFYRYNLCGEHKDPNDSLLSDRAEFIAAVEAAEKQGELERERRAAAYREKNSAGGNLQLFVNGISAAANTEPVSSGFPGLDRLLDGGLYEGLITIGAISSLGKTSLCMQIMDSIAAAGNDVLIVALEMGRAELMAKSISRETILNVLQNNGRLEDAKTARGITAGHRYRTYSSREMELIQKAVESYGEYADHVFILEGMGNVGVGDVRRAVQEHKDITGQAPAAVLIDYLQLLAPDDNRLTDKQAADRNVMGLKQISRDFKIPVLTISSFNRENYDSAVSMKAFKESGAIEYSSDVLIGLQLAGAGGRDFDAEQAKSKNPRSIELKILKNRYGPIGKTAKISMEFYPLFNLFREVQ